MLLDHRAQQGAPRAPAIGEERRVEVEPNGELLLLLLLLQKWRRLRRLQEELLVLLPLPLLLLLSPALPPRCCKVFLLTLDTGEHRGRRSRRGGGCDVVEVEGGRKKREAVS